MIEHHFGCILDERHYRDLDRVMGELPHPLFGAVAYGLKDTGADKLSIPYKSVQKYDPGLFGAEAQTTGDCTSHGTRNACEGSRCVEIDIKGEAESHFKRTATEPIYGARGHGGAGMSPAVASRWVNEYGIVARMKHGDVDLSVYKASWGIGWGRRGIPDAIKTVAKKHPVQTISLVTTVEEARDALHNGYCMHIGSNQGFSSTRDSDGFAKPRGSWSHDMSVLGCDFTPDKRNGFMILNSWGLWNSGGHPWWGELPTASFMCDVDTFARMLRGSGCWVLSNVEGFPPQELPDYGTPSWL